MYDPNLVIFVNDGTVCNATQTTYTGNNVAGAFGDGSVLNFLAGTTINAPGGNGTFALGVGSTNFNFTNPATGLPYSTNAPGATIHALGDLTINANPMNNSRGVFVNGGVGASGTATQFLVDGNLTINSIAPRGLSIENYGVVNVQGTTNLNNTLGGFGIFNGGTGTFNGATTIKMSTLNNATNNGGIGISNRGTGKLNFLDSLSITTQNGVALQAFESSSTSVTGKATITTLGDGSTGAGHGVYISGNGGATVSLLDASSTISTAGNNAHGIYVVDSGAVAVGSTASLSGTGPSVLLAAGADITTAGAGANAVHATAATGMATITNAGKLTSSLGNGIDTTNALGGSTINNSGDITATAADKFVIAGGDAVETVTTTAGTLTGNTFLGAGNDTFTASGGTLAGNTLMGKGDDVATLSGSVNVSAAPQFDGGAGTDVLTVDGLAVRGFTATSNDSTGNDLTKGTNLTGWETINVKNKGSLKLSDNLFTAANTGDLNIDSSSTLDLKGNSPGVFTIFGNVNNSGAMTMADGAADDKTTITGNYTGVAGSTYAIDTVLGDDASATDRLIVNGNTSGATRLLVTNVGGAGAQTVNGINVVQVDGTSAEGNFTLAAPVQGGSYEYTLKRGSAIDNNDFYLTSKYAGTDCKIIGNCPVVPATPIDIYRPAVANYVTAQSANADAGFAQLSTLHQRMGEQRGEKTGLTTDQAQTWGRIFAGTKAADGKTRFNYDSTISGFQFGRDLMHSTDADGTQKRAGVTAQYSNNSIDSVDTKRSLVGLDTDTGHTNAVSVGLGGYYTHIANDGTYFDGVAQINHLQNKFKDAYGMSSKQKGWQLGLSGEVGKTVAHLGEWAVEPQAQLSYLYNKYNSFSDKYSNIDGFNAHNLRARVGVRLNKDELVNGKEAQYYGIANVHHDLLKTKNIMLHDKNGTGSASVTEQYDRTSWELGAGIQGRVGKATYLYGDARYERSFKGNTSAAKVTLGVKSSF